MALHRRHVFYSCPSVFFVEIIFSIGSAGWSSTCVHSAASDRQYVTYLSTYRVYLHARFTMPIFHHTVVISLRDTVGNGNRPTLPCIAIHDPYHGVLCFMMRNSPRHYHRNMYSRLRVYVWKSHLLREASRYTPQYTATVYTRCAADLPIQGFSASAAEMLSPLVTFEDI